MHNNKKKDKKENRTLKFTYKNTGARIAKTILKKENKMVITLPDEKPCCIVAVIKIYHRHIDQWIRIKNSEIDLK